VNASTPLVNAWLYLNEDEPSGTLYDSRTSCYQRLIAKNVYQSVNNLNLCFVTTLPTSAHTVPKGDGSGYTISTGNPPPTHPPDDPKGPTNQDYMLWVIRDARKNNPNIKIAVTLLWGDGNVIKNIFSNPKCSPQENADHFAANLMDYLKHYGLDGFDIDWESPLSSVTTKAQFALLVNAIGARFKKQTDKHYYLTLSPAEVGNLDASAVNNNMDFVNLQLYSGFTSPSKFVTAGVHQNLFAYGAKFEALSPGVPPDAPGYQTAIAAFKENQTKYHYNVFTCWRLNSENFVFEQDQQQQLYRLVFPKDADKHKSAAP
jgi:GH18 family chitinase